MHFIYCAFILISIIVSPIVLFYFSTKFRTVKIAVANLITSIPVETILNTHHFITYCVHLHIDTNSISIYTPTPSLFKYYADQIVRRCVPEIKFQNIISFCHEQACRGHFSVKKIATKVLHCGFYWPTIFWDVYTFYSSCGRC